MKNAFTLAEVLITLGIIGIIAAITIPMLIKNYKRHETEVKLKKAYSMISQAFLSAQTKQGEVKDWAEWDNAEEILTNYIIPEFTFTRNFKAEGEYGKSVCFDKNFFFSGSSDNVKLQYGWLDGTHIGNPFYAETASTRLPDGSCLALNPQKTNIVSHNKLIAIDINGSEKAPNVAGYDLFFFIVDQNTIKPNCLERSETDIIKNCKKSKDISGFCCSARIIKDGWKIKYW